MTDMKGRVMGLDFGEARIGVSMSDPMRMVATPHSVIATKNQGEQTRGVAALVAEHGVTAIVVGMPYELDGSVGPIAATTEKFMAKVASDTGLPLYAWDERFSSAQAERAIREGGGRGRRRKGKRAPKGDVDMMAATILLQSFLDSPVTEPTIPAREAPDAADSSSTASD